MNILRLKPKIPLTPQIVNRNALGSEVDGVNQYSDTICSTFTIRSPTETEIRVMVCLGYNGRLPISDGTGTGDRNKTRRGRYAVSTHSRVRRPSTRPGKFRLDAQPGVAGQ